MNEFEQMNGERIDYGFDYAAWLGADTISASGWGAVPALTLSGPTNSGAVAAVFVAGVVGGEVYAVTNTITTAGGRVKKTRLVIRGV